MEKSGKHWLKHLRVEFQQERRQTYHPAWGNLMDEDRENREEAQMAEGAKCGRRRIVAQEWTETGISSKRLIYRWETPRVAGIYQLTWGIHNAHFRNIGK